MFVILVISLFNILTLYKLIKNELISFTSLLALTTKITTHQNNLLYSMARKSPTELFQENKYWCISGLMVN